MDSNSIQVQAKDIAQEFSDKFDSALSRYKRKRISVEGVVKYVGPDMFGLPSIELSDSSDGETDSLCVFNRESSISKVNVGDVITVNGNFIDCVPKYGPTFKQCEIVAKR